MWFRSWSFVALLLLAVTPAFAWELRLDGGDRCTSLRALRVDPAGDVLALGFEYLECNGDGRGPNFIIKVSGTTGQLRWRRELPDFLFADVLLLDGFGNPFVGQYERHDEDDGRFNAPPLVARLSGQSGEPVWTRADAMPWATTASGNVLVSDASRLLELDTADGSEQASMPFASGARLVGTHPRGDAIVEQSIADDPSTPQYDAAIRIARLSWPAGAAEWTKDLQSPTGPGSYIQRIVVDGAGNVLVAGIERSGDSGPRRWAARLLGGRSGDSRWATILEWPGQVAGVAGDVAAASVDRAGDVLLAGNLAFERTAADFAVAKLSRAGGQALWRWSQDDGTEQWDSATAMVADATGDVIAVGVSGRVLASRAPVVKLAGADGAVLWQKQSAFRDWAGWDTAQLVVADANGDVVVGGEVNQVSAAIAKLSGRTGSDFPCGNGVVDGAETCDDGNLVPNDGCESDCGASASCDDEDPCSQDALEPSGCVFRPIPGLAGQRCVLQQHYPPTECELVPRRVRKAVDQARKILDRSPALSVEQDRRVQRALERAARRMGRANVSAECRDAVLHLLADVAARNPAS